MVLSFYNPYCISCRVQLHSRRKYMAKMGPELIPTNFFTYKRNLRNDMKLKVKTGVIFTDKNMSKGIIYGHALFFSGRRKIDVRLV